MNPVIRSATKEDAELIADISRQTFYDTFAADNTKEDMDKFLREQFTKGRLMLEVGSPENSFLLAYFDDKVAGYIKLREGKQPIELIGTASLELARLYVVKDFIGKRIGAALMQKAIAVAKEKSKHIIWLGVWEKNQRAIDFYHRFGFTKFGECDFLLGNDVQRDWL
ncbi:MAG TPA: GNAT family N-acetyltransferase, partial [Flavisolibacter sp.]